MNVKTESKYGVRHLRPNNLSQLKREMNKQLAALRTSKVNLAALKLFGSGSATGPVLAVK